MGTHSSSGVSGLITRMLTLSDMFCFYALSEFCFDVCQSYLSIVLPINDLLLAFQHYTYDVNIHGTCIHGQGCVLQFLDSDGTPEQSRPP